MRYSQGLVAAAHSTIDGVLESAPRNTGALVVKGRFRMEFRDRHVGLEEGEFLIVPRGVEHRPVAEEEAHVLLFEPASTLNTGNVQNERTVAHLDRI